MLKNELEIKEMFQKEKDIYRKYEILYDYIYDYLCNEWHKNNYCDFKNDKCLANRKGISIHPDYGCCYKKGYGRCLYLKDKTCSCKSISCKFFTCSFLRRKGIKFKPKYISLLNELLTRKQKKILVKSLFVPKEEVIELLVKYNKNI